ncbi:MAG: twin-arginine translocase TatA/TatE family subunit, partial [Chloroflexota bacterium]|nr:twin-arginine translocase TatA/TatE family subunit [Chloroflexota bacterium]
PTELLLVATLVLIVFGPGQMPELMGRSEDSASITEEGQRTDERLEHRAPVGDRVDQSVPAAAESVDLGRLELPT